VQHHAREWAVSSRISCWANAEVGTLSVREQETSTELDSEFAPRRAHTGAQQSSSELTLEIKVLRRARRAGRHAPLRGRKKTRSTPSLMTTV
jgi:hypothetical protein